MGISKEIKQTTFRSENHKAMVNIIFSSNWLIERIKNFLEKEDITHQQYNILRILKGSGTPLSTLQIRERMIDKMSDTSRIVERLLKKDLANKVVCLHDKRLVDVTITQKGLSLLERLEPNIKEMDSLVAGLNQQEAEALNELLDKMREHVKVAS
ncbi:MAG: MarR family transcriptional regulator [Chitinophagaceae bacterium]|nr:MarR family transcriptional regulator [Chitinophagaceae bacterium]